MTEASGRISLTIDQEDAAEITDRLRETRAGVQGRAYLLRLDRLIERLGPRWEAKKDLVFDHLKVSFERKFPEPDWCVKINEDCFLAVILTLGEYKGALSAAELWATAGQFFVGDVSEEPPPLYEALPDDVNRLRLIPIDLSTYFDRAEARPFREGESAPSGSQTTVVARQAQPVGVITPIRRAAPAGTIIMVAQKELRVACVLEPVFEMKKLTMIGHRFGAFVSDAAGSVSMDAKALASLDWNDLAQIDITAIEQGLKLLQMRQPAQRKIAMIIPAAFSTFASTRARAAITAAAGAAGRSMGLKIIFEIRNLNGVPMGRIMEVASLLRPFCMTSIGHFAGDGRAVAGLKGSGLAGTCFDFDGGRRDDPALEVYLSGLSSAARASTGACMIHGFDTLHQVAVARLAGVTHASVRPSG